MMNLLVEILEVSRVAGEECGDSPMIGRQAEEFYQTGLTDIQANDNDTLAQKGERHGQVGGDKGLSLSGNTTGTGYDVLLLGKNKSQIGSKSAEGLFHHIIGVLSHRQRQFTVK